MTDQRADQPVAGYLGGPSNSLTQADHQGLTIAFADNKSVYPAMAGFEKFSRSIGPMQQRTTLIVRHEKVQTTEETYRFIGSKLPMDQSSDINPAQAPRDWTPATDAPASPAAAPAASDVGNGRVVQAIQVVVFMIVGSLCAVLISPYSPFKAAAPLLMMFVMPASAIGAVVYALIHEHRRRTVA